MGDYASLICTVHKGDHPLTIEWFLNGKLVVGIKGVTINRVGNEMSILKINSVDWEHSGKYTCRATNWAGSAYYAASLVVNGRFYSLFCFWLYPIFLLKMSQSVSYYKNPIYFLVRCSFPSGLCCNILIGEKFFELKLGDGNELICSVRTASILLNLCPDHVAIVPLQFSF